MPTCSVKFYENWHGKTKDKKVQYFRIPKDERADKWIKFCDCDVSKIKDGK